MSLWRPAILVDMDVGEISVQAVSVLLAARAAELCGELGYAASSAEMMERLQMLERRADHAVLGAFVQGELVGWIDVGIVFHLQSGPYGEIGGLVVGHGFQRLGIGKRLVDAAEQWTVQQGVSRMVVRSQLKREEAHRFYEGRGYERVKTSAVFGKELFRL